MRIIDIPEGNRPRERMEKYGVEVLSDAELFAIILRTGSKQENIIDISNRLIKTYGLSNVFDCSLKELQQIKGIGKAKAMQILAISELKRRSSLHKKEIKKITNAKDVFDLFHDRLKDKKQEEFWILLLDTKNNIILEKLITKGILDASIIHPREVFKEAIKNSANRVIILHNHPSGNPEPSEQDLKITQKLIESGDLIDIEVLDHIIIGKDNYWSWMGDDRI